MLPTAEQSADLKQDLKKQPYSDELEALAQAHPAEAREAIEEVEHGHDHAEPGSWVWRAIRDDWPIHQPIAPSAPIPGRHWYSGCEPADYDSERGYYGPGPRVNPKTGICEGCGRTACPDCGHGFYPDGQCGCTASVRR